MPRKNPSRSGRPHRDSPLRQRVREQRRAAYRQAINEAAERVFADKGAEQSRMQEIAAEAGVSLGTLYAVIDGKESLLQGIQMTRMGEFFECIRAARDSRRDTLARHVAVVRLGAQFFLEHPDFLRMCCRAGFGWASEHRATQLVADIWDEGSSVPRELFARGIEEGIYVDENPELLVRKMLALKQVELAWWVDEGMSAPHDEVIDRIQEQFIRAFCIRAT
ncbi:MAG: TetR/AcrR family transcriptional regulator [bacterium]|nr:TetR/AcrR family transcriptional regulator [bacterium]